ncbi:DoxX family protein [Paenibacillus sp. 1P07SE]|uniref:DoxX family protein n=1 Tax=Paenibacillus sp. 1P07SE TaxID=3132209 RepID=UPI0039A52A0D
MKASNAELGSMIVRIGLGFIFFMHGLQKFQGGIDGTVGFFESLGIPGFMAYVVALVELLGGISMMVGLGTRILSLAFIIILLVATFAVSWGSGFSGNELHLALGLMALHLLIAGSRLAAADSLLGRRKSV